jgi:hypothetical protein
MSTDHVCCNEDTLFRLRRLNSIYEHTLKMVKDDLQNMTADEGRYIINFIDKVLEIGERDVKRGEDHSGNTTLHQHGDQ